MKDIIWGVIIIAIGLFNGSSVLTGNPTTLDFVFDGLGLFFIGRGALRLFKGSKS